MAFRNAANDEELPIDGSSQGNILTHFPFHVLEALFPYFPVSN